MRLKAIRLRNIKKFGAEGICIDGICDRLSILAAPNEFGKSTIFEAVRTMLQQKHNAKNKQTRALSPLSNSGAPEVEIEVESGGQNYRIWKRFLSGPKAQVSNLTTGFVVADDGNADDWVSALIGADSDSYGPLGLLWVEQGTSMDQPVGGEGLLSSLLEAEVGALVGGDRARTYLQRCQAELNQLITGGGKPKTGGAYKDAIDELDAASSNCGDLDVRARAAEQCASDLDRVERNLRSLTDPEEAARRSQMLMKAEEDFVSARQSAGEIEVLESRVLAKQRLADDADAHLNLKVTQTRAVTKARGAVADQQKAVDAQVVVRRRLEGWLAEAEASAKLAKDLYTAGRRAKAVVDDFDNARTAWDQRGRIAKSLERANEIEVRLAELKADLLSNKVTQAAYNKVSELVRDFDRSQARLDATRPVLKAELTDQGQSEVLINGHPAPVSEMRISGRTEIELGALGRLEIETHDSAATLDVYRQAEKALNVALEALSCTTFEEVSAKADARRGSEVEKGSLTRELADIAPEGTQKLAAILSETAARIPPDFDPGAARPEAPIDIDALELRSEEADALFADRGRELSALREMLAVLTADLGHAQAKLEEALGQSGPEADWDQMLAALKSAADAAREQTANEKVELERRRGETVDLQTAKIARERLVAVKDNIAQQIANAREEHGRLLGELRGQEAVGVSEQLAQAQANRDVCQRRVDKIEQSISALQLLAATLESSQQRLKEAYFKPVEEELQPLLRIVLGKTDIVLSEAYQADRLRRGEYSESVAMLSGGTREQVAVLTRLAFGRMMARQNKPTPVFLDDALVYCDDERLGAMFNALHAASADVQCIVLTCHERAFRDIGGVQLTLKTWAA